jgi:hypothetical protein
MRHARLDALNVVISFALVTGFVSTIRIFGKVWYYLALWAWGTTLMMVLSMAWDSVVVACAGAGRPRVNRSTTERSSCSARSRSACARRCRSVPRSSSTCPNHSCPMACAPSCLPPSRAIDDAAGPAVGRDGRYLVRWKDALLIGSQGYGLVNELERDGYHVGVPEPYHVPVTPQRVFDEGTYDAELQFVSGDYIEQARQRDGFVEVAHADVRSDAERERFEQLRDHVLTRLTEVGREDLIDEVDRNLFGASLDPDLPRDIVDDMSEMLLIGEPVAVFLAPPGSGADAGA